MKYFDIADMKEGADPGLVKRLGLARVFSIGKEIAVTARHTQNLKNQIVCSRDTGTLMKAIKDQDVIGISFEDNEIVGKAIAAAKDAGKPVMVNISCIFAMQTHERYRNIGRIRGLIKAAAAAKAELIIYSGARNPNYLLSISQITEVAKFLGQSEAKSKESMAKIGEYIDS